MTFYSKNPVTQEIIWEGAEATPAEIAQKIKAAEEAFPAWKRRNFEERALFVKRFQSLLEKRTKELSTMISKEMGKPLWESVSEIKAMRNKIDISIQAFHERCPMKTHSLEGSLSITRHKPHGVVAVFGPFNFPGHLPSGHIIPALLAGNTVLFKPSELTPGTGQMLVDLWHETGIPKEVIQIVQGGKEVGLQLVQEKAIRGIFFTGSHGAGRAIAKASLEFPGRIVALEMGGNNPLIIGSVSNLQVTIFIIIQSAFLTSGQRCSCARRLILIENEQTEILLEHLVKTTKELSIGAHTVYPEPYMGPVVTVDAAKKLISSFELLKKSGGRALLDMKHLDEKTALLSPGIIDMTGIKTADCEYFGPLLQIILVKNLDDAIQVANDTAFGLCAGIVSDQEAEYQKVLDCVRAGVINWNTPTTGASSLAPFGGLGLSGNFRPSAYYAADYSAYPVASTEALKALLPPQLPPGFPRL